MRRVVGREGEVARGLCPGGEEIGGGGLVCPLMLSLVLMVDIRYHPPRTVYVHVQASKNLPIAHSLVQSHIPPITFLPPRPPQILLLPDHRRCTRLSSEFLIPQRDRESFIPVTHAGSLSNSRSGAKSRTPSFHTAYRPICGMHASRPQARSSPAPPY